MEKSSSDLFKKSLDNAYAQPNMTINTSTMIDNIKYKQSFKEEKIEGGLADKKTLKDIAKKHTSKKSGPLNWKHYVEVMEKELEEELRKGMKVEMEHTKDKFKAKEIAMDHLWEDPKYYRKLKKIETKEDGEKSAKRQFAKDLQTDKDFNEYKKRAKFKNNNSELTYGTPNVSIDDTFINKKKYSRVGKEETKEATGTGSSGAFEGPLFGGNPKFLKKSQSETPKLKEGLDVSSDVKKVEATEATGSGSVGGYETPAMWAKSTKKKDWGPSRKTQYKGGSFVKVKKKCTKFPYCNQGDINALKLTKNESVKEAIKSVSKKLDLDENIIINILEREYKRISKTKK